MAAADLRDVLMAVAILALVGLYVLRIVRHARATARSIGTLPDHLDKAFAGDVPVWLRLVRVLMIMLICLGAAVLISKKLGYTTFRLG